MRITHRVGRVALIIGLGALAGFSGCNDLADINASECGNGIIDAHEDCDTFAFMDQPGTACRPKGMPDACRFDCSEPPPETEGEAKVCPAGYICGVHGSCYAHSGEFRPMGDPIEEDVFSLAVADFDGDGRKDVMSVGGEEIRVRYYEETGVLAKRADVRATFPTIAIGQLTEPTTDHNADFAFNVGGGFGVMRGQADRTLLPTQYPFDTGGGKFYVDVVPINSLPDQPGDEVLVLLKTTIGDAGLITDPDSAAIENIEKFEIPVQEGASALVTPIAVGNVLTDLACDDLVVAYVNPSPDPNVPDALLIYTPCIDDGTQYNYDKNIMMKTPKYVVLPPGHRTSGRAFVLDINSDGLLDIVVSANAPCTLGGMSESCCALDVAYGTACAGFPGLSSTLDPIDLPDHMMSLLVVMSDDYSELGVCAGVPYPPSVALPYKDMGLPFPLAFGDLNNDGIADFVDPSRIWQGTRLGSPSAVGAACSGGAPSDGRIAYELNYDGSGPWTSAVIADFNLDGAKDIIGGHYFLAGLDFYQGAITDDGDIQAPLNSFAIQTQRPPALLTLGNFDGDLAPDLAFAELNLLNEETGDSISVVFGEPLKPPSSPVQLGRVDKLHQLVAGDFKRFTVANDSITDLVAVSEKLIKEMGPGGDGVAPLDNVLLLPGSTDRQLQSPVRLGYVRSLAQNRKVVTQDTPIHMVTGQFTVDTHADVAVIAYQRGATIESKMKPMPDVIVPYEGFALWMLESEGEAEFRHLGDMDPTATKPAVTDDLSQKALADTFFGGGLAMVAVDLGTPTDDTLDGTDEIVIFVEEPMAQLAHIFTASVIPKPIPGSKPVVYSYEIKLGDSVELFNATSDRSAWARVLQTEVADMNNDGRKDIVVLFEGVNTRRHLAVLWNHGAIKGTDISVLTEHDSDGAVGYDVNQNLYAFALLNADDDTNRDIAFVTDLGTYITEVDSATLAMSEAVQLSGLRAGSSIAAGDITGDGVDDLVIGDYSGAQLYAGEPQNK